MKQILETLKSTDYLENIKVLLNSELCSPRLRVEFALMCAKDELQSINAKKEFKRYEASKKCIELLEKWLVEQETGTKEELKKSANAASAAYYGVNAAYYGVNATYSAAYYTIYYAANYAHYVANAANAAYNAAYYAAEEDSKKLKQYYEWLFARLAEGLNMKTVEVLFKG